MKCQNYFEGRFGFYCRETCALIGVHSPYEMECEGCSNRPASEGHETPMLASASPARRRDQEDRAPAETSPLTGGLGQGAKPHIRIRRLDGDSYVEVRSIVDLTPEATREIRRWFRGLSWR